MTGPTGKKEPPAPDSLEPTVIVSKDGRSAIQILYYEEHASLFARESLDAVAMYFTVRLVPKEEESRLRVVVNRISWREFEPSWVGLDDTLDRPSTLMQVAIAVIGSHLDTQGMPPHTPGGVHAASIEMSGVDFKDQKPATDQETFNYVASKIYWAWRFGLDQIGFSIADQLRLGVPTGDFDRVAIRGNGVFWNPSGEATTDVAVTYQPTGKLLNDFEGGRLPGQSASPIFQVQEKLLAPRYAAGREHFEKAAGYLTSATPDWPNAAKEAVTALESVAKIITGQPTGTLGDAIKTLRNNGDLPSPLDKTFEGIWGFATSTPGVRHGGTSPPEISESQANFIVNSAAAGILYLLEIDN